jgi:hypothetical protein
LVFDGGDAAELFWEKRQFSLGFSFGRLFIGGGAVSEGHQGSLTTPGRG